MFVKKLRSSRTALFFLVLAIASSCEKPDTNIGSDLLPDSDNLDAFYIDTDEVIAYNIVEDSVRTSPAISGMLGTYHDPMMGKHRSEMFFQLRLPTSNVNFGGDTADIVIDSLVLSLDYLNNFYGKLEPFSVEVFELDEDLEFDTIYYSNAELNTIEEDLVKEGFELITPDPINLDGISIGGEIVASQMRIRLDEEWGEKFVDPMNTENLVDNISFLEFFRGFRVKTGDEDAAITFIDLTNEQSKMTLYYHYNTDTINFEFDFQLNESGQRFNRFVHDYSESVVQYHLEDSTLGNDRLFLQAGGGLNIMMEFPTIESWKDSVNIAINKAEIVFPVSDIKSGLTPPSRIFAVTYVNDTTEISIPDAFEGDGHLGGFIDFQDQEYRINITRYFQQVLTGELDNSGLRIRPSFNATNFNRVSIFGFNNAIKPGKLELTYTKF